MLVIRWLIKLNPSFEINSLSLEEINGCCPSKKSVLNPNQYEDYWNKVDNWEVPRDPGKCTGPATPDIIGSMAQPQNFCYFPEAIHSGNFATRQLCDVDAPWVEYVVVELEQTLPANHFFYYEFYYKLKDYGITKNIDHDKNEVSMSPSSRLILPVDSFIHFAEQVAKLKDKLVSQGYSDSGVDGDAIKCIG